MEKLKARVAMFNKSLKTLERAIFHFESVKNKDDEDAIFAAEDSVVKRFEYNYDGLCKVLIRYLRDVLNCEKVNSPRSAFHEALKKDLLTSDETETLIEMMESRNYTVHDYNFEFSREVVGRSRDYYYLMKEVVERISRKIE